jgi:hypothetical protein
MWLAGQYTSDVQNALAYSSATGMLSGATSVAMLIITLVWVGVLFWWSRTGNPRFRLQHRDLHSFAFFGLAAAVFEVTDASLFALLVLYLAWLAFSLILNEAKPLELKFRNKQSESNAQDPPQSPTSGKADAKASNPASEKPSNESSETPSQSDQKTQDTADTVPADKASSKDKWTVETLTDKLKHFLKPVPIGAILAAAIFLSRDPLLRTQLASFARPVSPQNAWLVLLDPLARLATTLVPCLAIVLLTVLLDTSIEHWLQRKGSLDTYLKATSLALVLFSIFALGIGGLNLFAGTLGLKLSDRIVYYVTVPLLTSFWLDWKPSGDEGWKGFWNNLSKGLVNVKTWLALLSILASRLISPVTSTQVNEIIQTLQTLQF